MSGISKDRIYEHLNNNIKVFTYDTIDSTNDEAKRYLRAGLDANALFISCEQTKGRGRQGKMFYSPKNTGLYMSVVLIGDKIPSTLFITTAVSVIVSNAIEGCCGVSPLIKWVNDLYLRDKKICGILTEAVRDGNGEIIGVIVGIGINVNTDFFPDELDKIATSVGCDADYNKLAAIITNKLICGELDNNKLYIDDYKNKSMVIGQEITYFRNNTEYCGKAIDINSDGALIVQTNDGLVSLDSGEITIRVKK
ncbi:MAG: biotin--[acetyl-CoA-carboxylase] ligase [Eubacteriales bacterium]|nr:biotin--[acetyl-CoA-carboxylase] ligase [Eubacteriales bacterium]